MAFASFMWMDKDNNPGKYYDTGEDQHSVVARRYGERGAVARGQHTAVSSSFSGCAWRTTAVSSKAPMRVWLCSPSRSSCLHCSAPAVGKLMPAVVTDVLLSQVNGSSC